MIYVHLIWFVRERVQNSTIWDIWNLKSLHEALIQAMNEHPRMSTVQPPWT